jgi:phosphopantetheinyl transferase (holo-ACP synthase)
MKGKLIKTDVNFLLEDDKGVVIASTSLNKEGLSLSQKNCQEIERGYDLDELAMGYDLYENINFVGQMRAFKEGFQKALEVNADKRFTLKEMVECWNRALEFQTHKETLGEYIKSLKQTEFDVEIVMVPAMSNNGNVYYGDIPKLDDDGCLILKKL